MNHTLNFSLLCLLTHLLSTPYSLSFYSTPYSHPVCSPHLPTSYSSLPITYSTHSWSHFTSVGNLLSPLTLMILSPSAIGVVLSLASSLITLFWRRERKRQTVLQKKFRQPSVHRCMTPANCKHINFNNQEVLLQTPFDYWECVSCPHPTQMTH